MPISHIRVMFFRVPAFKILRASHRPLKWQQPIDSRLSVRSLMAAVPCGHGTDRQKRTKDSYEYTHHRVRGLKFPMGTTEITPSSLTFRLLKSNSSSYELPKLSSTTTMKLCASSPGQTHQNYSDKNCNISNCNALIINALDLLMLDKFRIFIV